MAEATRSASEASPRQPRTLRPVGPDLLRPDLLRPALLRPVGPVLLGQSLLWSVKTERSFQLLWRAGPRPPFGRGPSQPP
jgi:hypothetical protein